MVFVINLLFRTDRREEIEKELLTQGAAIDGAHIRLFEAVRPETADGFPSVGARGCFLSHLNVLKKAQQEGVERLLILEDDAHFSSDFLTTSQRTIDALQDAPWDIYYAGYTEVDRIIPTGPVTQVAPDFELQTTHAMAFNRKAIEAAIPFLEDMLRRPPGSPEGGPMHVDGAYNWLRKANPDLQTVISTPQIITQRSSRSDITAKPALYSKLPLISVIRKFKSIVRSYRA